MESCFTEYWNCTVPFGEHEDERAGEQFSNYLTRIFIHGWMKNGGTAPCENLYWCTPRGNFREQIAWYGEKCEKSLGEFTKLLDKCKAIGGELWKDSLLLQVQIHTFCLAGAVCFA